MSNTQIQSTKSEYEIQEIHQIINKYKANNFIVPILHLLLTFLLIFFCLNEINKTKNIKIIGALIILLSLVLIRLFVMFHDMVHKSYFPSNEREDKTDGINFYTSLLLQPFILFSSYEWNKGHSQHHLAHGNSNEYDKTKTVISMSDYDKLPYLLKVLYDIFRIPFLFFPLITSYIFFIGNLIVVDFQFLFILSIFTYLLYHFGKKKLVYSFFISMYLAGLVGLMLFHLQHQVNIGYYQPFDNDNYVEKKNADLKGASVLEIPYLLKFFTFGIEYHNVHHFNPGIPGYNMRKCHEELVNRGLIEDNKVSYIQSIKSLFHSYYDDKTNRYISNSFFRSIGLEA